MEILFWGMNSFPTILEVIIVILSTIITLWASGKIIDKIMK